MAKGNFKFEVIKSGKRFLSIDTRILRDFINSFVAENAFLLYDKKISLSEEKDWQKSRAKEIDAKTCLFITCWDGKVMAGNSEVRLDRYKQRHNATFDLAVRKEYRGKGLGEKLLKLAIKEAQSRLKSKNLWIEHIEGNTPARKLYEKLGFREVARMDGYVKHGGRYVDRIIMQYIK